MTNRGKSGIRDRWGVVFREGPGGVRGVGMGVLWRRLQVPPVPVHRVATGGFSDAVWEAATAVGVTEPGGEMVGVFRSAWTMAAVGAGVGVGVTVAGVAVASAVAGVAGAAPPSVNASGRTNSIEMEAARTRSITGNKSDNNQPLITVWSEK